MLLLVTSNRKGDRQLIRSLKTNLFALEMEITSRDLTEYDFFSDYFQGVIQQEELVIYHTDDVDLNLAYYPPELNKLTFVFKSLENNFAKRIVFPDTIETLLLDTNCNLDLFVFPSNMSELVLFGDFNQDVKNANFPLSLVRLTLSGKFNRSVKNSNFPIYLYFLTFGDEFNQDIRNAKFPEFLVELTVGANFNQPIKNANFPAPLQRLSLGEAFNRDIKDANFPNELTELILGENYNKDIRDANFPESLTAVTIGGNVIELIDGEPVEHVPVRRRRFR